METQATNYDVAIIGGGAAGLSAAMTLGRSRRSVIVIDSGEPRNAPASAMHNFLSRDGMNPLEFLAAGRAELAAYGVKFVDSFVTDARRHDAGYVVSLDNENEISARHLILASGLKDQLPAIPSLEQYWGDDVLHCPFCHGWEVRDRRLGVLDGPMATHQATMFTQWSKDVTLFKDPTTVFTAEEMELFHALNVKIVEGTVTAVQGETGSLRSVELSNGTQCAIDALVIMPEFMVDLSGMESLGLEPQEHPSGLGEYIQVAEGGSSGTPGLWVAGSLANPMAQVIMAAADGAGVGMRVSAELMQEDFQHALMRVHTQHEKE